MNIDELESQIDYLDMQIRAIEFSNNDPRTVAIILKDHLTFMRSLLQNKLDEAAPAVSRCGKCGFSTRRAALFCPNCAEDMLPARS